MHVDQAAAPRPVRAAPQSALEKKLVGAVVVGGDYQGLGIVRSLGRHGIPTLVVDDEFSAAPFSRYCTRSVRVRDLRQEKDVVDSLLAVGSRCNLDGWMLYPTRDELVAAFSRNKPALEKIFRVPTAPWSSVQWAWDKRNTYRLAKELDIPIPCTYCPMSAEDLKQLADRQPPFALKPAIKEHFIYATKAKAWRADSHAALEQLYRRASELAGPGEILVQELIPGGSAQQYAYCGFFRGGKAFGKMVVRRARQHPPEFGRASTYVETVDVPVIEELAERFLKAIDYYGLVELEFMLDPRDSTFKLLDVNARTWGYHSLGASAGVDFSYMLYADQLNIPVVPCRAQSGLAWVRMVTDVPAALVSLFHGDLDFRTYVRSLRNCKTDAVFSWEDPVPGLAELVLVPYLALTRGF